MPNPAVRRRVRRALGFILPAAVLLAALAIAAVLMRTRPDAHRNGAAASTAARLVRVATVHAAPSTLMIAAHGTVEAAQSTQLRPRVSGRIVALKDRLAPGTEFRKGETLARIDDADYHIALTKAQSQLDDAKAALATENGQQAVAKRELDLVGAKNVTPRERRLALRGPQLAKAKANVKSAQAAVHQARLNLSRTRIDAPFDGIVTARSTAVGDVVSPSDTLATLAATDSYWVDLSMPVNQLRWIHAPGHGHAKGSAARVYYPAAWGQGAWRHARVLRIQGQLEKQGRLARVLLRVPDPLDEQDAGTDPHRLLLGAYITARLAARMPAHSVVVDAAYIRENHRVWVMTARHTLAIRAVTVAYRGADRAVISKGLQPGDRVVTSDLNAPIAGMPLRTASPGAAPDGAATDGASGATS